MRSVDRSPGLKRTLGLTALGLGVLGVIYAPNFLVPPPAEVAASQTSKDLVTVTTSKPVLYGDRRLQRAIDEIKEKCGGELTIEVEQDSAVNILPIKVAKPACVGFLSKEIKIGVFR